MILVIAENGQLGTELSHLLIEKQIPFMGTTQETLDITDENAVNDYFEKNKPTFVYHCAAYTAVDKAEDEAKQLNEKVNVNGSEYVAKACQKVGATLVYISTDYVFDGTKKEGQYEVDDQTNPKNEYGRTKLLGEEMVKKYCPNSYIIRTSWVFGKYGHNFVYTMLRLSETHDTLTVVNDQYGRPTWTRTLAEFMVYAKEENIPFGTYHLSNEDSCSWFDFATEILKDKPTKVLPVTSEEYPQKAYRPKYSVMSLEKTKATGFEIISWQEALQQMMASI